jgi:glucose/arabinose dehydrogenase
VAFVFAAAAHASAQLRTRVYASGFSASIAFVQDPADRTVQYVVQQGGLIRTIRNGVVMDAPFLDLRGSVVAGGEQGLLGLAFPPDYGTSGLCYVFFTAPGDATFANRLTISRFRHFAANRFAVNPSSRTDMLWSTGLRYIEHNAPNHNGGNIAFGPDGFLYIGTGDGGGGNDQFLHAQNPNSLLGKMLRIDVNVPDFDTKGFRIPASNPFQPGNSLGARPEIWAFGLRNPWRWSFDDPTRGGTGALVIADVGQNAREEVNYEPAGRGGRNYGWSVFEGTRPTGLPRQLAFQPAVSPIHEYDRSFGISITGGYVYRGLRLGAAFRGRYFFADFGSGRVWSLGLSIDVNGEAHVANIVEHTSELGGVGNVSSFGVDADGELYIVDYSGRILALDRRGPAVAGDVDGDSRTDLVVWRPTDGVWYAAESSTGYTTTMMVPFGSRAAGDIPLMGDLDGDGQRDLVTWRWSTGVFEWRLSSTNYTAGGSKQWGEPPLGDMPLLGDFDGDRRSDLVVWRAQTGEWFWLTSSSGYTSAFTTRFGGLGDQPLLGDFDGDGRADITVWRPSTGQWFWLTSSSVWTGGGLRTFGSGTVGDMPLLGDFDGDGRSDIVVWRAPRGQWFWLTSSSGWSAGLSRTFGSGTAGDIPLLGDFDGDGRADITVWRAPTGQWFWLTSSSGWSAGAARTFGSGSVGDMPMVK